jgi:hypothetical protein
VETGTEPGGAIVVAPVASPGAENPETEVADRPVTDVHLAVAAGTSEAADDMDSWVQALDLPPLQVISQDTSYEAQTKQESRQP